MSTNSQSFDKYMRATNYLTVAQIFLQDNFLLERPLEFDDIKPRLLGHWGSGPGVNLSYMHMSKLIQKYNHDVLYVLGPGHAFPALQANLFLEGTLTDYYQEATHTYEGIGYICKNFSWPYGFPSHSNPGTPGVILEGGELGYSLSTSFGAVLDNPDLIVTCLVGDGEAETGAAAGAWHLNKIVDPKTNGIVLPILHLNGYKISNPTVFGRMSDTELLSLFTGYGYQPRIVDGTNPEFIHRNMEDALDWAYQTIINIKSSQKSVAPRLPMIIMRTLKGWTGVKEFNNQKIEGNCWSHQVVLTEAKSDHNQLKMLENWLRSYKFHELFSRDSGFGDFIQDIMPSPEKRMGASRYALGGEPVYKPLNLPNVELFAEDANRPGTMGSSSMRRAGLYLGEVFKLNAQEQNFRFMSPDETYSNKLDDIFQNTTRAWVWHRKGWDQDMSSTGRSMEMLSEQSLQGLAQGYALTGRHCVFASYEAFIMVVASMVDQYAKFLHQARKVEWRGPVGSITYILTSSAWRQDHNGFSHQNPGFLDDVLNRKGDFVNVYFPPDGNTTLAVLEKCLSEHSMINVIVAAKTQEPRWLTSQGARQALRSGVMIWDFASDDDPQLVFAAAGDYLVKEALAAMDILKTEKPDIRLRFVNILSLSSNKLGSANHPISVPEFHDLFTNDKQVICNFHGYPDTLKSIIYNYSEHPKRFSIHGYTENGSTTTPFDMHVRNKTSRYDLAIEAFELASQQELIAREEADGLIVKYRNKIDENIAFIKQNGIDLPEIDSWQWNR
ncbi:phosphoketolase family protein [Candidatus Saccharibacteria bacterium]|nr:phosphoketolase family protein [Candidatus Saccharibacteria bacterium]HOR23244.1 phosphoketolase family protein [Candidatus Saccharibacteria bacterium]